jgi:hypothetical protein
VSLEQRWRQVEWLAEYDPLVRERVIGAVTIITSPLARLSLSAIQYFAPFPVPHVTVPHLAAAEAWATERLREAGLASAR